MRVGFQETREWLGPVSQTKAP
uniref:Uncharacterized protein n=1 Tax=Arundo donax TaxID=35708 RepID=A0A0A8ZJR4_ARUDO